MHLFFKYWTVFQSTFSRYNERGKGGNRVQITTFERNMNSNRSHVPFIHIRTILRMASRSKHTRVYWHRVLQTVHDMVTLC